MSDVLVLADGTKIDKATGKIVSDTSKPPELIDENEEEVDEDEIVAIKKRIPVNRFSLIFLVMLIVRELLR